MPGSAQRGRPRDSSIDLNVMRSALEVLREVGFRAMTLDAVAAHAGVGKMTIYRRWPNKAQVVMEAFLQLVSPLSHFPPAKRALERLRLQMQLQAKLFSGPHGKLIKSLLGEAQFDHELAHAFRDRWLAPRRALTREILLEAMEQGDLRKDVDIDLATDLIYAPFYYRLQLGVGSLDAAFSHGTFELALTGLGTPH